MAALEILKEKTKHYLDRGQNLEAINRLFRYDECFAFKGHENRAFALLQKISDFFQIPIRSIHFVGSAQLGYSVIKSSEFQPGKSDLDIAIVNTQMFLRYSELCYNNTDKYRDLTKFTRHGKLEPPEVATRFREYLANGYLRPDYMPKSKEKDEWLQFFERAGDDYIDIFKKLTCGIYLSEAFFSSKQHEIIEKITRFL